MRILREFGIAWQDMIGFNQTLFDLLVYSTAFNESGSARVSVGRLDTASEYLQNLLTVACVLVFGHELKASL